VLSNVGAERRAEAHSVTWLWTKLGPGLQTTYSPQSWESKDTVSYGYGQTSFRPPLKRKGNSTTVLCLLINKILSSSTKEHKNALQCGYHSCRKARKQELKTLCSVDMNKTGPSFFLAMQESLKGLSMIAKLTGLDPVSS
jgi:hypothetical protein